MKQEINILGIRHKADSNANNADFNSMLRAAVERAYKKKTTQYLFLSFYTWKISEDEPNVNSYYEILPNDTAFMIEK